MPYFLEPKNEEQQLFNYQHDFLRNGSKKAETNLWLLAEKIAKRIIRKEQKKKRFFLNSDEFQDKAVEAVEYIFRRYKKDYTETRTRKYKKWYVRKSFLSCIKNGVLHSLYYGAERKVKITYYGDLLEEIFGDDDLRTAGEFTDRPDSETE